MASTHVDDIFVLFNVDGKRFRDLLFQSILLDIPVENLGPVSWALKTSILRDRQTGILKISQEQYTRDFLAKSASDGNKFPPLKSPATTPNYPEVYQPDGVLDSVDEKLKKEFQSDIGAFWWLAQISRPDIYYAVHRCAKLVNKPNKRLGQRIQKIKDYLRQTPLQLELCSRHTMTHQSSLDTWMRPMLLKSHQFCQATSSQGWDTFFCSLEIWCRGLQKTHRGL